MAIRDTLSHASLAFAVLSGACVADVAHDTTLDLSETALSSPLTFVRRGSGKCLDVAGAATADGTKIQQWTCNGSGAQRFALDEYAPGKTRIVQLATGKCVDAASGGRTDGTQIQLWTCNGTGAQDFRVETAIGGFSRLSNPQSGKCLDVNANANDDGAKVQLWTCNASDAQAFALRDEGTDPGEDDDADYVDDFATLDQWWREVRSPGGSLSVVGHAQATDGRAAALTIPGRPDLGPGDWASPGSASELVFNQTFLYGKFETRVRFASCAERREEVVNGIFTYFRGGDQNGNGITDNSEIDIEQLCGTPSILWLTTYTDFDDFVPGRLRKLSKKVDMRTGAYEVYTDWPPALTEQGRVPGLALPSFPDPNQFYTVGFEWRADGVRYYIRLDGRELDLFTIRDPSRIPRRQAGFLLNVWHASTHWTDGASADYPANPATMLVDSVKIWR